MAIFCEFLDDMKISSKICDRDIEKNPFFKFSLRRLVNSNCKSTVPNLASESVKIERITCIAMHFLHLNHCLITSSLFVPFPFIQISELPYFLRWFKQKFMLAETCPAVRPNQTVDVFIGAVEFSPLLDFWLLYIAADCYPPTR